MDIFEIADKLKLTSQLMELHEENPFKIKSLANASFKLSKSGIDLNNTALEDIEKIDGIGKGIAQKMIELIKTGKLNELEELKGKTPEGVIKMLNVKGIGPKKVRQLWTELGIESIGELLYACYENRLLDLKGFGTKTQESIKRSIEFMISSSGWFHFAYAEQLALTILKEVRSKQPDLKIALTGDVRRKCDVLQKVEFVIDSNQEPDISSIQNPHNIPVVFIKTTKNLFFTTLFETTATKEHLQLIKFKNNISYASEEAIYKENNLDYIEPELREGIEEVKLAAAHKLPTLIQYSDLKGTLHNHTTYSDGLHSLKEMALQCKKMGLEYLGICDHSQSAVYAKGLTPEQIHTQHQEIDSLNHELAPFKIFKGIESDILGDGSLDYSDDILNSFDFIVASVHSNLKMDEEKATRRLIRAIENPYTTILGHPTGRLLLSRPGYPIDHKKIIDACAANKVIIELNANPFRLDIDWRWIPYCLEKGVKISINPDAHEKDGFYDMYYGTCAARKGMLTKEMCFNTLTLSEINAYFKSRKK